MDGFLPRKGVTLCSTGNEFEPLRRCLAPEVVSRRDRTRPQVKRSGNDDVGVTLNAALATTPENRVKWFTKACEMAKNGRASSNELFDIVSNRKFVAGLPTRIGKTLCTLAHENASLFSEGQVRYMQSNEWLLNSKYGLFEEEKEDEEAPEDEAEDAEEEQRPVFRTRHPDGDEEVARRLELERKLNAEEMERRWKREQRKYTGAVQDVDFTVRLMTKQSEQPEKTKQELEQEADSSLQVLEKLSQRQHTGERHRRRRDEVEDTRRDLPVGGERRRRRREEAEEVLREDPDIVQDTMRRGRRFQEAEDAPRDIPEGGERKRRRREEAEEVLRDAPDGVQDTMRRSHRFQETDDVYRDLQDVGERRRRRREETGEVLRDAPDGIQDTMRRGRRFQEAEDVQRDIPDGGERRRRRREEPEEVLRDVPGGRRREEADDLCRDIQDGVERRRRRREETGDSLRETPDCVDDGMIPRRRRRRSTLASPSPTLAQDPGPIRRRRRQTRSQSTSVSVQAARISPSSSRDVKRRRGDRSQGRAGYGSAAYEEGSQGRYASHRQADESARRQADEVAAHREHVRKEAEDIVSSKGMLSMQHVEALRDVYRQDRISRNRAKLMKLGLGHELPC